VPNRPQAQALGMKIFLDSDSMDKRFQRFLNLVRQVLDPESLAWAEQYLTPEFAYLHVFGHELGHPICVDQQLITAFGEDKPLVEELKATLFALDGIRRAIVNGRLGDEKAAFSKLAAAIVPRLIGILEKNTFTNPTVAPYINECMAILDKLMDAGTIRVKEDGKLRVETILTGSPFITTTLRLALTVRLVSIYQKRDLVGLRDFVAAFCVRNGDNIRAAFKAINNNL
jgi:hypothetical protein